MFVKSYPVPIVTAADGTGSGFTDVANGRVLAVLYVPDANIPYSDGFAATVTTEDSGQAVVTRTQADGDAGFALYPKVQNDAVADGTGISGQYDYVALAGNERVKIAIASGGNAKAGSFSVLVG